MPDDTTPVLAVYDFRSKQEFIYRTNRMREITGASELIAGMYERFLNCENLIGRIRNDWAGRDPSELCDQTGMPSFGDDEIGTVVYEGGGNLCVLYRNRECYVQANRVFSMLVLEEAYSLSLIAACAPWECSGDPDRDFDRARARAYRAFDAKKRTGGGGIPCNVLPFTQVDAVTYQAIVEKGRRGDDRVELSRESQCKLAAHRDRAQKDRAWELQGKFVDEIGTEKGEDSLIAVVYFDGNSIGERLKQVRGVRGMRSFSHEVHETLVTNTEAAMKAALLEMTDERQRDYRVIVDHGDEITLVCNAHAAPIAVDAYFRALEGTGYHACAGIAICHSHDPFSEVYRIAEECCESGKERNREAQARDEAEGSYVDFHFCRAGITGSLGQVRGAQEASLTCRPYRIGESYDRFCAMGELLASSSCRLQRSDLKGLGRAVLRGDSWYGLEFERLCSKDTVTMDNLARTWLGDGTHATNPGSRAALRNVLFDLSSFIDIFDVRFGEKGGERA